ncbi:hypothetical protein [Pseudoduganella violaceinigra]|uniref:hypothetical protein n=1 Tax=Pseudoduganella violaceinigra TaxID=246602 RepID=UPI00040BE3BE|nr:hypothetical protein [Pseudoduganella violaceinigra]
MHLKAILPVLFLLTACGQKATASHKDKAAELADGNSMSCVAGNVKLAGAGSPQVAVAGFGIHGDTIGGFGLGLNVEHAGKVHEVSSSLMPLPLQTGTHHFPSLAEPGMTLASYKIRAADGDLLRGYNGGTYSQQFSAIENDPDAKLKIQIDKMVVSDAPQPGFKRIHAVGYFEFNAAALPASSPSDACVSDGVARSLASVKAGKRLLPLFDAAVCDAEKKHVRCDFDVVTDFTKVQ